MYIGQNGHSITTRVMKCYHHAILQLEKLVVADNSTDLGHYICINKSYVAKEYRHWDFKGCYGDQAAL